MSLKPYKMGDCDKSCYNFMLFSRKLVHNWYMASGWIKEKYESCRLRDGCLSIIEKNQLID